MGPGSERPGGAATLRPGIEARGARSSWRYVVLGLLALLPILLAVSVVYDFGAWRAGHLRSREPMPLATGSLLIAIICAFGTVASWQRARRSPSSWLWRAGALLLGAGVLLKLLETVVHVQDLLGLGS